MPRSKTLFVTYSEQYITSHPWSFILHYVAAPSYCSILVPYRCCKVSTPRYNLLLKLPRSAFLLNIELLRAFLLSSCFTLSFSRLLAFGLCLLLGSGPKGVDDLWYHTGKISVFSFSVSMFLRPPSLSLQTPWVAPQTLWLAPDPPAGLLTDQQISCD